MKRDAAPNHAATTPILWPPAIGAAPDRVINKTVAKTKEQGAAGSAGSAGRRRRRSGK